MRQVIFSSRYLRIARWAATSAALAGLLLSVSVLRAADPAFVGILALATEDTVAQRLALSDEVTEKLRQLVQKRENAAIDLALSIKDLPPEERARRLGPFVQESERLGMELLTLEQRSKLSQLRLQRAGMASLAEPDMGQLLKLSPPQQAEIRRLLSARALAMTRGGEQDRRIARDRYERSLRMILNDAQKATWDQMAGLGPGPPKTTEPAKPTDDTAIAGQPEKPAMEPAVTTPPQVPPAGDQPAASLPAEDKATALPPTDSAAQPALAAQPATDSVPQTAPTGDQSATVEAPDKKDAGTTPATADASAPSAVEPATPQTPAALTPAPPTSNEPEPATDAAVSPAPGTAEVPQEPAATPVAPAVPVAPVANENPPSPSDVTSAPTQEATVADEQLEPKNVKLRFNFKFQPWGEVLDWLAEQADLSLQSDLVPEGTFNYSDNHEYTPTEAIDLINGVLLTQGYTLVRRGRLLTILNLQDDVPDVLVEFVPVEQLDERGEFELVKTVFHLAKMEPADAEQEIGQLLGPGRSMIVMPKARQIMVTETAGKLRTIRDVIERAENPKGAKDKGVTEFVLEHASPEEILLTVRPLLGLAAGENVGEEISIAQDPTGTRLFAAGSKEKIQILEDLVERLDQQRAISTSVVALEQPQLMTHPIDTADPAEALAVLQTLLAGSPDVRLSLDDKTRKIIALARPSEHRTISETIKQLEGQAPHVEVIQLRRVDPQIAVLTIGKFFSEGTDASKSAIKIDADPTSMKLYVKATEAEMTEIKRLIEKLEGPADGGTGSGSNLRFIPLTGGSAEDAVETARRLWLGPNRIQLTAPSESGPSLFDLKEITPERPAAPRAPSPPAQPSAKATRPQSVPEAGDKITADSRRRNSAAGAAIFFASFGADELAQEAVPDTPAASQEASPATPDAAASAASDTPSPRDEKSAATDDASLGNADIRIEFTPNGVLITSEDTKALDKFEDLLRTVAGPQILTPGKNFTVYFLKFCKADVARQLIQDILGGTSSDGGGGSLMGDVASNLMGGGGGILGALLGGGGGGDSSGVTSVQATGPVTIVADSRLNCLVVQALPVDLQLVEQLLKVIDREGSITDIQTAGKPHIIPVVYMNAADVASVIKEAYASRIATAAGQGGGQPNPADLIRALRGGRGGRGGGSDVKSEESKMTVAVDTRSNALIITAPDQLYQEVKDLVTQIDQSGMSQAEEIHVVSIKNANPEAVQKALAAIMGQTRSSNSSSRTSNSSMNRPGGFQGGGSPSGATSGDIQNRMNFMRAMQGAGGFQPGGGGGPGGFQPGGGGFGGRGGFQPGQAGRGGGGASGRGGRGGGGGRRGG